MASEVLKVRGCDVCGIGGSSALQMYDHVVGHKHRANVRRLYPGTLLRDGRLQHFLDNYLKLEPVVGLEFVEELQGTSAPHYTYKCLLCDFQGALKAILVHVTGRYHTDTYLEIHQPAMWAHAESYAKKPEYTKMLKMIVSQLCMKNGRKGIKEIGGGDDDKPKAAKPSHDRNPAGHPSQDPKVPKPTPDRNPAGHPSQERKAAKPSHDRDPAGHPSPDRKVAKPTPDRNPAGHPSQDPKVAKPTPDRDPAGHPESEDNRRQGCSLRFKNNGDFLDYLQRFEIQNDEDAELLKRITQNCTQALVRFRKEETRQNEPPQQDPPTGKSKADLGNAAPTSQDAAIQQFFNSIKNMEESEVVRILRDIAATNPAFRSIDVHNVIKYLQATGRVKTS